MNPDKLEAFIEKELPEWRKAVKEAKKSEHTRILLHTSAFLMEWSEFTKLGAAIKYAGQFGLVVEIIS